jgi:hypothetical protein
MAARVGRPPDRVLEPASGELITDVADGPVEDGFAAVGSAERDHPTRAAASYPQAERAHMRTVRLAQR